MDKIRLNVDQLEVVSFATEREEDELHGAALITGTVCVTRPTLYGTCCTP